MKIAVVGGGSTYTPELVDGLARLGDRLPLTELVLIDPSAERLEPVGGLAQRILAHRGHPAKVVTTSELERGVDGANAVLIQLRVGGQQAREQDETWPLECGCLGQETTGAGGLAKALRTVPVVLDIAERVRESNPDAWIINFTNPVGIVTRGLLRAGHRAVGLCNVAIHLQRTFAELLDLPPEKVHLDHYGLNHLSWALHARHGGPAGEDLLPALLERHGTEIAERLKLPEPVLRELGVVPSPYLRYYYAHDEVVEKQRQGPSRASEVAALERELLRMYQDPSLVTKPSLLAERGGAFYSEAAVALAASLLGADDGGIQVVNGYNQGTFPQLPADAVIETPVHVTRQGPRPLPAPDLSPVFMGLISHVTAYEHLALDAANLGGRNRVYRALLAHPLVGQYDRAEALTDQLLAHNREYLPWL
ncbi:6-phospho-beta-glucosidase [Streptomyces sp. NPDC005438]|uniref:6-phospho-beta-glucosidase n=1 Tax=Streptomyces sp. NPDC005438 TaxID=3156880 RepID=UPI0033A1D311